MPWRLRHGGGEWIRTIEAEATDLQSAPFDHSGTPPYSALRVIAGQEGGAGGRIRTPDLLITNQLLYQLSYTSGNPATVNIIPEGRRFVNRESDIYGFSIKYR